MHAVIYVYEDFTPLEVFGVHNLLSRTPDVTVDLVAEKKGIVYSSSKDLSINIVKDIDDIAQADLLLIPGSIVGWTQQIRKTKVLSWIRQIDATTVYTTATCTGAVILAATGLLKDKKATAYWRVGHLLADYEVEYLNQPIVRDDKYFTAEGVTSTLDMTMQLGKLLCGKKDIRITQLLLAYESKDLDCLVDLKQDEELLEATNKLIFKEGKSTLSVFDKIRNAKLLLRLLKEE